MEKKDLLTRLKAYTALTGTLLFPVLSSPAQVIYKEYAPPIWLGGDSLEFPLDLNNDGIMDFNFHCAWSLYWSSSGGSLRVYVQLQPNGMNQILDNVLSEEEEISSYIPFDTWQDPGQPLLIGSWLAWWKWSCGSCSYSTWHGFVWPFDSLYLPLKVNVENDSYFGWTRMDVYYDWPYIEARIHEAALSSTPNEPIVAGELGDSCFINANIYPHDTAMFCGIDSAVLTLFTGYGSSYQWLNNGGVIPDETLPAITITADGDYSLIADYGNNCVDTSNTVHVTFGGFPDVPIITQVGDTLFSSAVQGNQWYVNGEIIPGATGQFLTPSQNGTYSVVVTNSSGCQSTSGEFTFVATSLIDLSSSTHVVKAFISGNNLTIELSDPHWLNSKIEIYNSLGQNIRSGSLRGLVNRIYMKEPKGVYFLRITKEGQTFTFKFFN
ncbi:MAG: T9SS type A sorting domain-containing protein [Bacteroidetes bacterium]|nr:T9SS type A sorting domain-containing protein [Bacteroidota bacterium]